MIESQDYRCNLTRCPVCKALLRPAVDEGTFALFCPNFPGGYSPLAQTEAYEKSHYMTTIWESAEND